MTCQKAGMKGERNTERIFPCYKTLIYFFVGVLLPVSVAHPASIKKY